MLDADLITSRARVLLGNMDLPFSPQAGVVIKVITEAVNKELTERNGHGRHPTLEMVKLAGAKSGLPDDECEKFFNFYESKGWKVGKSPMISLPHAIANWRKGWEVKRNKPTGAQLVILGEEYKRTLKRIEDILNSVDSHRDLEPQQRQELMERKARRDELKNILGIKI